MLALKMRDSWGGDSTDYLHGDHLGSVSNVTDSSGNSMVGASYDAFGDRRGTSWTGDPTSWELTTLNGTTRRGFTEHEMLDSTALVHMNGRVFNPVTARFGSADPHTDWHALNTQGWNRYAYVGNRALSLSDPTGFSSSCEGCHGGGSGGSQFSLSSFFSNLWAGIRGLFGGGPGELSEYTVESPWVDENGDRWVSDGSGGRVQQVTLTGSRGETDQEWQNTVNTCVMAGPGCIPVPPGSEELAAVGALGLATIPSGGGPIYFSRALVAADFGEGATFTALEGTLIVEGRLATLSVQNLAGSIADRFVARDSVLAAARATGATTLRIEGTIGNPALMRFLESSFGPALRAEGEMLQDYWLIGL